MNRVIKVTENVLFVTAMVIMICALLCQMMQIKPVVVVSGSMEPAIMTGSLAFIDKKAHQIAEGDVISFRSGDALVTHRVVEITDEGYRTKGDNNKVEDVGIVEEENVEGKVAFNVPGLGYFLKVIALPAGTIATLLYLIMKGINRGKRYD